MAQRPGCQWGTIEPIDSGSCQFRTGDDDLRWLAVRIAMLGVDFEVHEPPELVQHMGALGERLKRAAGQAQLEPAVTSK
jgi:predicted DNA-binding transcriptional regulator YafY